MAVHKERSPRSKLCLRHRATMRLGRERAAARGSRNKIKKGTHFCVPSCGDPDGNRTRVTAVKGRCLSRLTTGPKLRQLCFVAVVAEVGFEPTTFRVWTERSSQLSYSAMLRIDRETRSRWLLDYYITRFFICQYLFSKKLKFFCRNFFAQKKSIKRMTKRFFVEMAVWKWERSHMIKGRK